MIMSNTGISEEGTAIEIGNVHAYALKRNGTIEIWSWDMDYMFGSVPESWTREMIIKAMQLWKSGYESGKYYGKRSTLAKIKRVFGINR